MKKCLAVHKNVAGCEIREMINTDNQERYFTAKIRGWNNFKFDDVTGTPCEMLKQVTDKVKSIRDKIDNGDKTVFN
jgi:hypothetical protein